MSGKQRSAYAAGYLAGRIERIRHPASDLKVTTATVYADLVWMRPGIERARAQGYYDGLGGKR